MISRCWLLNLVVFLPKKTNREGDASHVHPLLPVGSTRTVWTRGSPIHSNGSVVAAVGGTVEPLIEVPTSTNKRGGATARTPSSFVGASTSGTLAPPLATMRPVRSLSGRRSQGTPCVSPRAPPTREMRCSSRPSYRRASRGFWVPSGLGFRCSWCLVCTVPSAFRFATRLPNKTRPQSSTWLLAVHAPGGSGAHSIFPCTLFIPVPDICRTRIAARPPGSGSCNANKK